jgi:hypothetical protein
VTRDRDRFPALDLIEEASQVRLCFVNTNLLHDTPDLVGLVWSDQ